MIMDYNNAAGAIGAVSTGSTYAPSSTERARPAARPTVEQTAPADPSASGYHTVETTRRAAEPPHTVDMQAGLTVSIERAVEMSNQQLEPVFLGFEYRVHEGTNRIIVSVMNTSTQELIREIPPEETLDALEKMWELRGILFDQRQ